MSVIIDSGEVGAPLVSFDTDFFAPIGPYYGREMVHRQLLQDGNGNITEINSSEVENPSTIGFLFSIRRQRNVYSVHKVVIGIGTTIDQLALINSDANQVGPTLFLPKSTLAGLIDETRPYFCRVGRYDDGRRVLFLHARDNEADRPVRIPSE